MRILDSSAYREIITAVPGRRGGGMGGVEKQLAAQAQAVVGGLARPRGAQASELGSGKFEAPGMIVGDLGRLIGPGFSL